MRIGQSSFAKSLTFDTSAEMSPPTPVRQSKILAVIIIIIIIVKMVSFYNITYWTTFPRWVPEDRQECKENVEQCVNVTKPYCREVEELLIETI